MPSHRVSASDPAWRNIEAVIEEDMGDFGFYVIYSVFFFWKRRRVCCNIVGTGG